MTQEQRLQMYAELLPYSLKVMRPDNRTILDMIGVDEDLIIYTREPDGTPSICGFDGCRPILRPMSDLTKGIAHEGETFVPFKRLGELFGLRQDENNVLNILSGIKNGTVSYNIMKKLIEWHFNVFNLPETEYIVKE